MMTDKKKMQQLMDNQVQKFMVCWISTISFLKLLFLWICLLFSKKHITPSWGSNMGMILRLIWNSIEIGFTVTQTLRSRTYERPEVSQPLNARNRFWALKYFNKIIDGPINNSSPLVYSRKLEKNYWKSHWYCPIIMV